MRKYLLLAASAALLGAAPGTSPVAFIPDQPLGYGAGAGGVHDYEIQMFVDGAPSCQGAGADRVHADDDWICKGQAAPGPHEITASIRANTGATWRVTGRVQFKDTARAFEYPDRPESGEKFWCVLVSKTQISLLSAHDRRCHTD